MKVILMEPYAKAQGIFSRDGEYYRRMLNGKVIAQRRPNRKGHVATEGEKRNQERFAQQYAVRKKTL